ncbi:unnamed protein product [Closterium sp. NIES-64]|nr:unnamed protein product [Closterium sp. NIES-64]
MEVQSTTKFQELPFTYLNKKQYVWLHVTFERARDANFVWKHVIVHTCIEGKTRINLDWQHPMDPAYVKVRAADPTLVEVLFKGVDAVITPDMLREMLVVVKLVECCDKANKVTFAQAAEHVVSQCHGNGLMSGSAARNSKAEFALATARNEFGV